MYLHERHSRGPARHSLAYLNLTGVWPRRNTHTHRPPEESYVGAQKILEPCRMLSAFAAWAFSTSLLAGAGDSSVSSAIRARPGSLHRGCGSRTIPDFRSRIHARKSFHNPAFQFRAPGPSRLIKSSARGRLPATLRARSAGAPSEIAWLLPAEFLYAKLGEWLLAALPFCLGKAPQSVGNVFFRAQMRNNAESEKRMRFSLRRGKRGLGCGIERTSLRWRFVLVRRPSPRGNPARWIFRHRKLKRMVMPGETSTEHQGEQGAPALRRLCGVAL